MFEKSFVEALVEFLPPVLRGLEMKRLDRQKFHLKYQCRKEYFVGQETPLVVVRPVVQDYQIKTEVKNHFDCQRLKCRYFVQTHNKAGQSDL